MAIRHNLCPNPALDVNTTGWADGGAEAPTRTAVAGFSKPFAARYTTNVAGFIRSAKGAVTEATSYTLSLDIRATNNSNGTLYTEWVKADTSLSYSSTPYNLVAGVVTRIGITAIAPTGAVFARVVLDGINFSTNTTDITRVLIEAGPLDSYFDGDSTNCSWDGAAGLSPSTLNEVPSMANSISDQARVNMLAELALTPPQTLSNVDLARQVIAKVGQLLFPVTNKTVGGHYQDYLLVLRG